MKKFLAGFCAAAIAAGCMGMTVMADTEATDKLTSYEATSDNVKLIGRTYRKGDTTILGYSASGIEFKCTGTKAVFNVNGSVGEARIGVFVNGKLVDSFEVDGKPQPTEAAKHSIEFIGDSITCGYGVDDPLGKSFSIYNENAAKTYAYKAAQNFGADYSFVSVSGAGVIYGYSGNGKINDALLVPNFYDKFCFTWSWFDGEQTANYDWDFSQYQPELIVVNLGTNDNSYTKGDADKCAEFEKGYVNFLKEIRAKNPNSEILCTLGIMGQELYPSITDAVDTYKTETGDSKVSVFQFSVQDSENNGYAVDYHPSAVSQKTAAYELTYAIEGIYGWERVELVNDGVDEMTKDDDVEFNNVVEESSSDESSESKAEESSSEASSEATNDSSAAASSSKTTTNPNSTTNPNTDAAMGISIGLAALAGAAMVVSKRK